MSEALRLFLIEDDEDVALLIRKSLERVGHHVVNCRSAADALIVLAQSNFDLVLLDQVLPDMTGLQLLRALSREGITVPVLMITAFGGEHLAAEVLRAGALDYVAKDPALTFLHELPKRVGESVRRHRLELLNRLLAQALESASDGIMITDLHGTILEVNQALEELTGYTRAELVGQTPRLLRSGAHPPELYATMWQTILQRRSWQGELTNRRKDGRLRQMSITISPIIDAQGRLTHFIGIQRDMTEHKALERHLLQAQKMQSVGTLAGGVAHEFNNLLAGINGYAALALREPDAGPAVREFLQHIVDLSERAATLTRQLLAFARKAALTRQPTSLVELLRATTDLVGRTLHREVALEMRLDELPSPVVEADANQLQQALVNLAVNARDALLARKGVRMNGTAGDAIVFRLRHEMLQAERAAFPLSVPPGDYFAVEVRDSGIGMSREVLNQALDPFYTTKEVGQGTGLGLPTVFGIVQGHQGYLTIDTEAGQGTCVTLYLPRPAEKPAAGVVAAGEAVVVEPEQVPGRSILVIDDEEAVLDVIRRFLQIAGHCVRCASSGHDGLRQLEQDGRCDLVILDLMMPREDAAVTFCRLRLLQPALPVLLCTGLAEALPAPDLLRQARTTLIRKPFRMNELWYAVRHALAAATAAG